MEQKRLCRSMEDKAIFGVCSGFARYFDIDPIIIRLAVVLLALMGTVGVWFYIVAAIVMPKDTDVMYAQPRYDSQTGRPIYEAGGTYYENTAGTSYQAPNAQAQPEGGAAASEPEFGTEAGDTSGSWTGESPVDTGEAQARPQQTYQTYQAYQPQPEKKVSRGSRNTGILLIIIGILILAKIILPKINMWIPIAVAAIFFGIFLCCRKQ